MLIVISKCFINSSDNYVFLSYRNKSYGCQLLYSFSLKSLEISDFNNNAQHSSTKRINKHTIYVKTQVY